MRFTGLFVILLMLSGCYDIERKESNTELNQLYTSFIQKLCDDRYKLIKYITRREITDTLYIDSVNWPQELQRFTELSISKSFLSDYNYKTAQNGCEKIFQTNFNKHPIKRYKYLHCDNNFNVLIDFSKSSPLHSFYYHLELNKYGYLIEIISDVKMAYRSNYRIEGKFITNEDKTN
tara:strand:- start:482 stop:1012 length:531 start_codon:yes stop_codon:yes gene_type:complete